MRTLDRLANSQSTSGEYNYPCWRFKVKFERVAVYGRIDHPHEAFDGLRKNDPLRWVEPVSFRPFWTVTKQADIIEIEKNPQVFASGPRPIPIPEQTRPDLREELVMEIFKRLKDRLNVITDTVIDDMMGDGGEYLQASFVHGFKHLPVRYRLGWSG